jgi:hypothetical protein
MAIKATRRIPNTKKGGTIYMLIAGVTIHKITGTKRKLRSMNFSSKYL